MAKEKKSKKDGAKKAGPKKEKKAKATGAAEALKSVATNPLVQEVVAAALVATAAALKDSKKAHAMANAAGDQIEDLARDGVEKGKALWSLALEVAERAGKIVGEGKKARK